MRVSNGVSMRTGMAFLRNEFYNMRACEKNSVN